MKVKATKPSRRGFVRITGGSEKDTPFAWQMLQVAVGDTMLPCNKIEIVTDPMEIVKVRLEVDISLIDLEVLESQTELRIVDIRKESDGMGTVQSKENHTTPEQA